MLTSLHPFSKWCERNYRREVLRRELERIGRKITAERARSAQRNVKPGKP
jgi:hypothetical protein